MTASNSARLHHVALPVSDLQRSIRFYTDAIGLTEIERPPFDFPGAWFAIGDSQLHLIVHSTPTYRVDKPVDSRDIHFAVRVRDFEAALARLQRFGFREDAPGSDPMRMKVTRNATAGFPQIFVMDPDRHVIEINAEGVALR